METAPRSVRVRVGNTDLTPTHGSTAAGPRRFAWERAGRADLPEGDVFLEVFDAGAGEEGVDAVVLSRDGDWAPPTF
ncbi:MAG: hypothetical protein HY721_18370 [Planctomycetes bacterium]|nr:hypothetical protein [Planctomycetota bacterium]